MKKIVSFLIRAGITAILLAVLFSKINFKAAFRVILEADPCYLFWAIFFFGIIYFLVFYRWLKLLKAQGLNLSMSRIAGAYCGGLFFNLLLPSTIGGDVARSIDLGLHTKRHSLIIASVLLDRLSGFVGLVLVSIFSLFLGYKLINEPSVYIIICIITAVLGAIMFLIFNKNIYNKFGKSLSVKGGFRQAVKDLHSELYFFRSKPYVLILNIFYSVLVQVASSLSVYFILKSLKTNIKIIYLFILNPVISVITMLPISIGGLGLRDASSVFFYAKIGIKENVALAQSLINFGLLFIFGLCGGIIYVITLRYRRIQLNPAGPCVK